jgi:hypothetical protein
MTAVDSKSGGMMKKRTAALLATFGCVISACGRPDADLLQLDYECEFSTASGGGSLWSDGELTLNVAINLGSGRATVTTGKSTVDVQSSPDAGKLLLQVPDELGRERKIVIWPDGKAVLTEMTAPASRELRDFQGSCKRR